MAHQADPVTVYARQAVAGEVVVSRLVRQACARHLSDLEHATEKGLVWKPELAQRVIDFFAEVLVLPENTDADEQVDADAPASEPRPFVLQPWQQFIVGSLFGWYTAKGFRRFREALIETAKGSGKALALDTPIPTVDGWTTMGAIEPGATVFDEAGRPATVVAVSDVMHGHECYEVVFDDGSVIVADAEHLWYTEQRHSGEPHPLAGVALAQRGAWRRGIRTTTAIRDTLRYSNGAYQSANHSVPLCGPIGLPAADLPIPPYVLGVWLGDGDIDCARVTVADADAELLEHVAACGVSVGPRKATTRTPRYRLGGGTYDGGYSGIRGESLNAKLRIAGLLNAPKHIPAAYLRGSVEQRLALLQGLMDTDGYISPETGACEFCSTDAALASGVYELLVSLGVKASNRESAAKLYGREVSRRWRVQFHPPADLPVFRLSRKLQHQVARHTRRRLSGDRRIVDVRPCSSVPVRCIAVDSPSRLYLAGRSMIPTHNTPLCAGMLLYMLVADGELGAQVYMAATTRDQARLAFVDAERMVDASPDLKAILQQTVNNLAYAETGSFLRAISAERRGLDGKRVHGAMADELHEHPTAIVVNKMRAGTKGRRNALILKPTNSGFDRTSVLWQHHDYSRKVLDGTVVNEAWFAFICGLDPCPSCLEQGRWFPSDECPTCDDWRTEGPHWLKANPNLGVSLPWQYVRERVAQAKGMPSEVSDVLRFNFCVWTQGASRAIDMGRWAACARFAEDELPGVDVYGGLDLGESDDLSAWARLYLLADGRVAVKMRYWIPEAALERFPNRPYTEWQRRGMLTVTSGDVTDYEQVEADILADCRSDGVLAIAYDPRSAMALAQRLQGAGIEMVKTTQGFSLHEAIKKLLELVVAGDFAHNHDPILTWMASNVVLITGTKGEKRLAKEKSPEKIDGIAACVTGIDWAIVRRERAQASVYLQRGVRSLDEY